MSGKFKEIANKVLPPPVVLPALLSYLLEHIAVSIYWIFFGLDIITNLTDSYLDVALVFALPSIVSVIGTMYLSNLSDKTGKRKEIMFLSRIALMIQYTLLIFFRSSIWVILGILGSFGIVTQIYYTMNSALITTICPPDRRGEVSSFQVIFASAGWMIGGGLSGLIYSTFGINGSLRFAAFFAYTAGAIALLSTSKPWSKKTPEITENLVDLKENDVNILETPIEPPEQVIKYYNKLRIFKTGNLKKSSYKEILFRKEVLLLIFTLLMLDFGVGPFNVISSIYLSKVGLSKTLISVSNTVATAFGMVMLLITGYFLDRVGRKPFFIIAVIMYPIIYSLMFFLSGFKWAIFIIYLYPLYALKNPTANAIMSDITATNERARGMSLISIEQIIAGNLGAILGCYIADIFPTDLAPKFLSDGIFTAPFFPMVFGVIASIIAIKVIKETNSKTIAMKIANVNNKNSLKNS
ncbi:MAG: MFS transporter [Candidatus Heimdallarchaeota archaeon]|nr:MFS transporter [Candidatus Heimdallarchaeota archaeon]